MYDHRKQYRCTIIRGKSTREIDNLLPVYAKVINSVCPCPDDVFDRLFNDELKRFLPESSRIKKTLDNHRTEICGKLFGMYYSSEDHYVYESDRTKKFLADNDQPAFFKDICYKMQFPNGTQKIQPTVVERVKRGISLRPYSFICKLLLLAKEDGISISVREIGYYVLNSLDVLQGSATPDEVLKAIKEDRRQGITRDIRIPGKASSYCWQHIREQLNYMELANLIIISEDRKIILNEREMSVIDIFAKEYRSSPEFDVYAYDLNDSSTHRDFQYAWDSYYGRLSVHAEEFGTPVDALLFRQTTQDVTSATEPLTGASGINYTEMGDEGEQLILDYERKRVGAFNHHLTNRVQSVGRIKGLGYDIQSIIAEPGDESEFAKYIEVKSTKRITLPDIDAESWEDSFNITRNEWCAAKQFRGFYFIYRVYFTREGVVCYIIRNPIEKIENESATLTPLTYRVDFSREALDAGLIMDEVALTAQ